MSENLTFKGSKLATVEVDLIYDERGAQRVGGINLAVSNSDSPPDKALYPTLFPATLGTTTFAASELDAWFGGDWWRVVGRVDRPYIAVVEDDYEVSVDLASKALCWVDHSNCSLCTNGFSFALGQQNDPALVLAMSNPTHARGLQCCAVKSAVAARRYFRIKMDRVVVEPRFYYREKLQRAANAQS